MYWNTHYKIWVSEWEETGHLMWKGLNRSVCYHPFHYVQFLNEEAQIETGQEEGLSRKGSEKQSSIAERKKASIH